MKRNMILAGLMIFLVSLMPAETNAKPVYIKIRIGFFAKWSIALGDCKPGWGICISIPMAPTGSQNSFGYDEVTKKCILKVAKTDPAVTGLAQGSFELKEDSPVDPRVISQLSDFPDKNKTITLRKGSYRVMEDGDYYLVAFDYVMQ
jgi:hypothetical protein